MRTDGAAMLLCLLASMVCGLWLRPPLLPRPSIMVIDVHRPLTPAERAALETVQQYGRCVLEQDLKGLRRLSAPDYDDPYGVSGLIHEVQIPGVHATVLEWETPGHRKVNRDGFIQEYRCFFEMYRFIENIRVAVLHIDLRGKTARVDVHIRLRGQMRLPQIGLHRFVNHAHFLLVLRREKGRWLLTERRIFHLQTWLP